MHYNGSMHLLFSLSQNAWPALINQISCWCVWIFRSSVTFSFL